MARRAAHTPLRTSVQDLDAVVLSCELTSPPACEREFKRSGKGYFLVVVDAGCFLPRRKGLLVPRLIIILCNSSVCMKAARFVRACVVHQSRAA